MDKVLIIAIAVVAVLLLYIIATYNQLVTMRNKARSCYAGIDVQLKKRYDLVPQLVNTVGGYMKHEEAVITRLAELRSMPYSRLKNGEKEELDDCMAQVSSIFSITMESYPQLKASEPVLMLQRSLNETEEQLAASRRSYNAAVLKYTKLQTTFPSNIVANMFGSKPLSYYEAMAEERNTPQVNL